MFLAELKSEMHETLLKIHISCDDDYVFVSRNVDLRNTRGSSPRLPAYLSLTIISSYETIKSRFDAPHLPRSSILQYCSFHCIKRNAFQLRRPFTVPEDTHGKGLRLWWLTAACVIILVHLYYLSLRQTHSSRGRVAHFDFIDAWRRLSTLSSYVMLFLFASMLAPSVMGQVVPTYNSQGDYFELQNAKATVCVLLCTPFSRLPCCLSATYTHRQVL